MDLGSDVNLQLSVTREESVISRISPCDMVLIEADSTRLEESVPLRTKTLGLSSRYNNHKFRLDMEDAI